MNYGYKKHIRTDGHGNALPDLFTQVKKAKPKVYDDERRLDYVSKRELVIGDELSKIWLDEHKL